MFRLRRDGVTTAGHRDHRDRRDRDARGAGLRVSHRHAAGHAGFFVANAVLSRDPWFQGPLGGGCTLPRPRGTRPTPKNTKKAPPRTLPRVPWAQRDRPGRQTHVTRGANFPGAPSDSASLRGRQLKAPRRVSNHALNIQRASRPRPTHSTPLSARGEPGAAPPWRSTRISPERCSAAPSARRRRDGASARQRRRRTTPQSEKPPERARAKISPGAPTQASPKLFTSLCARKRAQNINSRAPATHRT